MSSGKFAPFYSPGVNQLATAKERNLIKLR